MNFRSYIRRFQQFPASVMNNIMLRLHGVEKHSKCRVLGSVSVVNKGKISLGERCTLDGTRSRIGFIQPIMLTTRRNAVIRIGNHVGMSNCTLYAAQSIEIGDDTLIGGGVKIYDTNFHSTNPSVRNTPDDQRNALCAPVVIGKRCFIGAGSIILKGVHIGDNSIVAAGSVVAKSIPSNEVWGGNPARKIKDV